MTSGIATIVDQTLGRSRIPASAKPRDPLAWTAEQALRTDDLPHRTLMGEKEAARRKPKQAPDIDKRQRIRDALTDEWQTLRQLMERTGCSKWLVYDELGGAVDEGCAEVCVSGGAKRARLYRRVR